MSRSSPKLHFFRLSLTGKRLQSLPTPGFETLSNDEATKAILSSDYGAADISVEPQDPLGIAEGTQVSVESTDSAPGSHPQIGKLIGTSRKEVVIQLENGLRLHFPRLGYVVRNASVD